MTKENPTLKDLIEILSLPNMGDEGRKAKLLAIKEWQILFLQKIEKLIKEAEAASDKKFASDKCFKCKETFSCKTTGGAIGKSFVLREEVLGEAYEP